jgi:hypothetical protein
MWIVPRHRGTADLSQPYLPKKGMRVARSSDRTPDREPRRGHATQGANSRSAAEFPDSIPGHWTDPDDFHAALDEQMRRHGDTAGSLFHALRAMGFCTDRSTLRMWRSGKKLPVNRNSFAVLAAIERRYRLCEGYFRHKVRTGKAVRGQAQSLPAAERRRLAWHLPVDFDTRPAAEREVILAWVRQVIVSGATDYRRYQRQALQHRYGLVFPVNGSAAGGALCAPPQLCQEMADLLHFKTALLAPLERTRRGVWGTETADQKVAHLGLFFGALCADPRGPVRGLGLDREQLSLALLIVPRIWDSYLQWRLERRGFFTAWELDLLTSVGLALTTTESGWLWQTPQLALRIQAIDGFLSETEAATLRSDWAASCSRFQEYARRRSREIKRILRVHHDPFEPILPILEAESPVGEYRRIGEEILARMPSSRRHPVAAAEAQRAYLMIRLGLHLGFRQRNLRELLLCPQGQAPRTERQLTDLARGELRWNVRECSWEVFAPACAFKNAHSSFFGGRPFRMLLPDLGGLQAHLDTWLRRDRPRLLGAARDPGTVFVKTVKRTTVDPAYGKVAFYEAWRAAIQRYGIYNPWTGRGAVEGLLPHGPHAVRDVLATHVLKKTGSYEQASYAIQDTPEMVARHYGRFLPQDKVAIAAQVLNRVWQDA